MPEPLTPETSRKLDDAARALSRKHRLDKSAFGELLARMESKLRSYLSGSEKLTEEDAFVLVREHFGDAENLRKLLRKVHAPQRCIAYAGRFAGLPAARM